MLVGVASGVGVQVLVGIPVGSSGWNGVAVDGASGSSVARSALDFTGSKPLLPSTGLQAPMNANNKRTFRDLGLFFILPQSSRDLVSGRLVEPLCAPYRSAVALIFCKCRWQVTPTMLQEAGQRYRPMRGLWAWKRLNPPAAGLTPGTNPMKRPYAFFHAGSQLAPILVAAWIPC